MYVITKASHEGCHKHSTDIMWNAALQKYFAVKKKKLIDLTDICPWKEKAHPQKQHLYNDKIEVPCFTSECEVPNGFFSLPKDYTLPNIRFADRELLEGL